MRNKAEALIARRLMTHSFHILAKPIPSAGASRASNRLHRRAYIRDGTSAVGAPARAPSSRAIRSRRSSTVSRRTQDQYRAEERDLFGSPAAGRALSDDGLKGPPEIGWWQFA